MSETLRPGGRDAAALRPLTLTTGAMKYAEGSARIELGDTHVLVSASIERRVPPWLAGSGKGWITAEYAMLPRATHSRAAREVSRGRPSGRSLEIQRLIGRSLRAAVDLSLLGEMMVTLDCDVIQADGGTRTAAITAAWVALVEALGKALLEGDLTQWPIVRQVAAVSVGYLGDAGLLDLEYCEDSAADVDMNVVADTSGEIIEIQGTGENRSFRRDELDSMLDLAFSGLKVLAEVQSKAVAPILADVAAARKHGRHRARPKQEKDLWGPPA